MTTTQALQPIRFNPEAARIWSKEMGPILSWHRWLKLWEKSETFHEKAGLLHCGFRISLSGHRYHSKTHPYWVEEPSYLETDRIIAYLLVAHGWLDGDLITPQEEKGRSYQTTNDKGEWERMLAADLRQSLAQKAFGKLCTQFFKILLPREDLSNDDRRRLIEVVEDKRLLSSIQAFFQPHKSWRGFGISNLSPRDGGSNHEKIARRFLVELAISVFEVRLDRQTLSRDEAEDTRLRVEAQSVIDQPKPWLVEVLNHLGKLHKLEPYLLKLDKGSLAKLEEIAMRAELKQYSHPISKDRPVASLEEAVYAGSTAAELLIKRRALLGVDEKLKKVREAERRIEEGQRVLAQARS